MFPSFRMVGDNLHEFVCCLCIDGTILRYEKCVPYKYFVTSQPKPWEFLHGAKSWGGEIVNRCLQVPIESFKIGGMLYLHNIYLEYHYVINRYMLALCQFIPRIL